MKPARRGTGGGLRSPMAGRLLAGLLLMAGAALATAGPAAAQSSLTATLGLLDPVSGGDVEAEGGRNVRLQVRLSEPATGASPRGLYLMGWARRVAEDNASCARTAQNFRATRRTPVGAVDLNGILFATLNRDASLSVVDPKLNLYSSNMVAAHLLDPATAAFATDRRNMRALAADPSGRIVAADLTGPGRRPVTDLGEPVTSLAVGAQGRIWAGTGSGSLVSLAADGSEIARTAFGTAPTLVASDDPENPHLVAFAADGTALLLDGVTGREVMRATFPAPLVSVAAIGTQGLIGITEGAEGAQIRYADAPGRGIDIQLGAPFGRVTTGPNDRIGVVWTPGDALVALIDFGRGRVVQQLSLDGKALSGVTFTDNAAYLFSPDGGFVGALDLATVSLGRSASLRRIPLGGAMAMPDDDTRLLVPLLPSRQILAVSPENQTGWVIGETASSVEMPPMDSVRLRGGVPRFVHAVDRSFEEVAPGVFETVWAFGPGAWELVLTTDIGDLSTCIRFDVRGEVEERQLTRVRLVPLAGEPPVSGRTEVIALSLREIDGAPVDLPTLTLLVPSMISGWSTRVTATAGPDGTLRAEIVLPHEGPYAVHPIDLPARYALVSGTVITAAKGDPP